MHAVRPASAVRRCTRARAPRSALALAHGADVPQPLPPPSPPNPHLYAPAAFACPTPPRLGPARRDASNAPSGNESRSSGNGSEPRSNELKSSENGNGNGNGSGSGDISDQEWEIRTDRHSTYAFSPVSGLIHQHTIDSIEPAPHQAVFDALRGALCKLGLADGPGRESPGAARSQPHTHARQG
ncbi:hypothetical protein IEO21_07797 [Rhodonia placenta]|uniref:Uncharacterized protein n=1 Tax=Rhodonia placenta TaxID=104341 RepID=A0A8H7TZB7_9APHY|nr:hypothetical protein IEO21_07797 [Postia placenta]